MKEKLNETIKEVELQKETYQQNETMMTELRDKILKLQEENLRLKDQVFANLSMFCPCTLTSQLRQFLNGLMLLNPILIQCFR